MHTIISIVGRSSSGKTTLLEKLIKELKQRGYKVAIIKHSHHAYELDKANKDTWRFTEAGSELSAIKSSDKLAVFRHMDHYFDPQEISNFILWDYDLILTEGFKGSHYPKIEVRGTDNNEGLLTDPQQLLAVVTDVPVETDKPQFFRNDVKKIADLIEKKMLADQKTDDVDLIVNSEYVPIEPSLKNLLTRTLLAMIPGLKDHNQIKSLHLSLRRKP